MRSRDCKIVATLGPASDPPERMMMVIEAGVDCFRLNFSHGSKDEHAKRVATIREAEKRIDRPIAIIADLQGPKLRVGDFVDGGVTLRYNDIVTLEASRELGEGSIIRLPHPEIVETLEVGDILKLDDGKLQLTITAIKGKQREARVDFGGVLKNRKGVNVPSRRIPISALTEQDKDHLAFALEQGVDYVALSFVQSAEDVQEARALIGDRAGIISKIEKPAALDDLGEITRLSDAIMVARGDLGVELPPEQVPIAQRRIIRVARIFGKPVIVATHMLESMIDAPTPTRAEASDVATAVYQGADAVMLSAESAVGRHPASAVAIMDRIIKAVEGDPDHWANLARDAARPEQTTGDAIAQAARNIAEVIDAAKVVAYTATGSTALRLSRERPRRGIIAMSPRMETARQLCLAWGVTSVVTDDAQDTDDMVAKAEACVQRLGAAGPGDRIVITAGVPFGRPGKTNMIRIVRIEGG
ncbi:MAG: pyruvate kinase [Alphaproteobacteria bacterium]|nr:pyruvate kinase [Alphaproteobacteria bacterium]